MTGGIGQNPQQERERTSTPVLHLPEYDDLLCSPKKRLSAKSNSEGGDDQYADDSSFRLDDLIRFDDDDDGDNKNGSKCHSIRTENSTSSSSNRPQEKQNTHETFLMKSQDQKSYQESLAASWSSFDFLDDVNDQTRTCHSDDGGTKQKKRSKKPVKRTHSTTELSQRQCASTSNLGGPLKEKWKDPKYKKNRKKNRKKKGDVSQKSAADLLDEILRGDTRKGVKSKTDISHQSAADLLNDILLGKHQQLTLGRTKSTPYHKSMTEMTTPHSLKRAKSCTPSSNSGGRKNRHKSSTALNREELWKPKASRCRMFDGSQSMRTARSVDVSSDLHKSSSALLPNSETLGRPRKVGRNRSFDGTLSTRSARSFAFQNNEEETLKKVKETWQSSSSSIFTANTNAKSNNTTISDMHDSASLQVYPIDFGFGFSSAAHSPSVRRDRKTVSMAPRERTKSGTETRRSSSPGRYTAKDNASVRSFQRGVSDFDSEAPPPPPLEKPDNDNDKVTGPTASGQRTSRKKKTRHSMKKQISDSRLVAGSSMSASSAVIGEDIVSGLKPSPDCQKRSRKNNLRDGLRRSVSSSIPRTKESPSVASGSVRTSRTSVSSGSGSSSRNERKSLKPRRHSSFSQVIHKVDKWKKKHTKEEEKRREELLVRQNDKDGFHNSFSTMVTTTTSATSQTHRSASSNISSSSAMTHRMNPQLARELDQYFAQAYVRNLTYRGKKFASRSHGGERGSHQVVVL